MLLKQTQKGAHAVMSYNATQSCPFKICSSRNQILQVPILTAVFHVHADCVQLKFKKKKRIKIHQLLHLALKLHLTNRKMQN